ncbi:hypothetical protein NHJ13051_009813 [Beauveria bassiana]
MAQRLLNRFLRVIMRARQGFHRLVVPIVRCVPQSLVVVPVATPSASFRGPRRRVRIPPLYQATASGVFCSCRVFDPANAPWRPTSAGPAAEVLHFQVCAGAEEKHSRSFVADMDREMEPFRQLFLVVYHSRDGFSQFLRIALHNPVPDRGVDLVREDPGVYEVIFCFFVAPLLFDSGGRRNRQIRQRRVMKR